MAMTERVKSRPEGTGLMLESLAPFAVLAGEVWRYLLISAVALVIDLGTLIGLTELFGVHYLLAGAAGFLLGVVTVYLGSVRWVFSRRTLSSPALESGVFVLIGLGGLGVNELMLWGLTGLLGLYVGASKIGAAGATFAFNFLARKFILFR